MHERLTRPVTVSRTGRQDRADKVEIRFADPAGGFGPAAAVALATGEAVRFARAITDWTDTGRQGLSEGFGTRDAHVLAQADGWRLRLSGWDGVPGTAPAVRSLEVGQVRELASAVLAVVVAIDSPASTEGPRQ